MKSIFLVIVMIIGTFQGSHPKQVQQQSTKELALSNEYLDLDVSLFLKQRPQPNNDENIAKAITYRFFKHVVTVKGIMNVN